MAVSPLPAPNVTSDIKLSAAKAKSLAVRTGSVSKPGSRGTGTAKAKGAELAEQLNEETRQKYVKGLPLFPSSLKVRRFLTIVRQKAWGRYICHRLLRSLEG